MLALENNILFWDPGSKTTIFVISPGLRQIQTKVNRGYTVSTTQSSKNTTLAVVNLAKLANPLAMNAYGFVAFFCKTGFVDIQCCVRMIAKNSIRVLRT